MGMFKRISDIISANLNELTEHTLEYRLTWTGKAKPNRQKLETLGATVEGQVITLPGHDADKVNSLVDLLRGQGVLIESVQPHRFSLEDILVEVVGDVHKTPPRVANEGAAQD